MIFQKSHIGLTLAIAIIEVCGCASAKLLDIEKTSKALQLSANQREIARTKTQKIEKSVEGHE